MNRKLQVFISSTFSDLREERQAAVEAVLLAGHIPAGMELFAAQDESQLETIKRWINESDIYMLILGGRYGTVENASQKSYTELEYLHARDLNKPLFSLVLHESAIRRKTELGLMTDMDRQSLERLDAFRQYVLSFTSRIIVDERDVKIHTLESLRLLEQRQELVGWIRADVQVPVAPLISEIDALRTSLEALQKENKQLASLIPDKRPDRLAGASESLVVPIRYSQRRSGSSFNSNKDLTVTWGELFSLLGPHLIAPRWDKGVNHYLAEQLLAAKANTKDVTTASIEEQIFTTIKVHLQALGWVSVTYTTSVGGQNADLCWILTPAGKEIMLQLRAVRSSG